MGIAIAVNKYNAQERLFMFLEMNLPQGQTLSVFLYPLSAVLEMLCFAMEVCLFLQCCLILFCSFVCWFFFFNVFILFSSVSLHKMPTVFCPQFKALLRVTLSLPSVMNFFVLYARAQCVDHKSEDS